MPPIIEKPSLKKKRGPLVHSPFDDTKHEKAYSV